MGFESDKVMFEIYREAGYDRKYCVVYFTELTEHNKEYEISRALEGEHLYDSFLKESTIIPAKQRVDQVLARLNDGEELSPLLIEEAIKDYLA